MEHWFESFLFVIQAFNAVPFLLSILLAASHTFWLCFHFYWSQYILFSLSLSFFFFAISSVNLVLFSSVVFNFYTFRDFPDFLLFWFLTILLGLENILYVFQFLKRHFISSILSMLVNVSGALGNNVYSILLDGVLSVCKLGQVG